MPEFGVLTLPEELTRFIRNPVMRLRSDLDAPADTAGWDRGSLMPGRAYRWQLSCPGVYNYTDGLGHTGRVVVKGFAYRPL